MSVTPVKHGLVYGDLLVLDREDLFEKVPQRIPRAAAGPLTYFHCGGGISLPPERWGVRHDGGGLPARAVRRCTSGSLRRPREPLQSVSQ